MTPERSRRLVDTGAAAVAARVTPATIRKWAQRGKITRAGTDRRGRALYDLGEVYRAVYGTTSSRGTGPTPRPH